MHDAYLGCPEDDVISFSFISPQRVWISWWEKRLQFVQALLIPLSLNQKWMTAELLCFDYGPAVHPSCWSEMLSQMMEVRMLRTASGQGRGGQPLAAPDSPSSEPAPPLTPAGDLPSGAAAASALKEFSPGPVSQAHGTLSRSWWLVSQQPGDKRKWKHIRDRWEGGWFPASYHPINQVWFQLQWLAQPFPLVFCDFPLVYHVSLVA